MLCYFVNLYACEAWRVGLALGCRSTTTGNAVKSIGIALSDNLLSARYDYEYPPDNKLIYTPGSALSLRYSARCEIKPYG